MHKTLATKISNFLISLIFSLLLFSCAAPNNSGNSKESVNEEENNNKPNEETPSYYAMIGTWINPDNKSDTITISEDTVTLSVTMSGMSLLYLV